MKFCSCHIRYLILGLNCLLVFGSYYAFDLPSTLERPIKKTLDINNTRYGLIYSVYAWSNCVMVLFGGVIIDKFSSRLGAIIFTTGCLIGQALLSIGVGVLKFPVVLTGRIIFGCSLGPLTVVQSAISAIYFAGKDLSFAFASTLTVSRIGSVINFYFSPWLEKSIGLVHTLEFGAVLCCFSFLIALLFFMTDKNAEKKGHVISSGSKKSRKVDFRKIKDFPPLYWLLSLICGLFYLNIFALLAVLPDYLEGRNGYNSVEAGRVSGTVYLVSIPFTLIAGKLVDKYGHRVLCFIATFIIMIPFNCLIGFTKINPIPELVFAGICYSLFASSLWPSVCLVVDQEIVGTALAITSSAQMVLIGISNIVVGVIKDRTHSYKNVMVFFLCTQIVGLFVAIGIYILDKKTGSKLEKYVPKNAPDSPENNEKVKLLKSSTDSSSSNSNDLEDYLEETTESQN
ncbi:major facilitator superfamily domain-containing protein [Anaeramoeba flamelloides]|uniref:Lysosomal dipeptide transporter MFSD1 n=1 Tax=Anaeramoeba flamelloides TaxID=1746091 RepID=A0ABQ8Z7A5_9EUKA|nr:major facilitator superfamily domain-containing protein [Anaeramoeba flamelloides]